MPLIVNPTTGELEWQDDVDPYFDPVLGDIDPLNEHKGVGGGAGDNSYSSVGVDPSTLWDPTKGVNWESLKKFITSPTGIAGLGGAALGFFDRAPPSGGGTTQTYQGPAQLTRTMVQGPYGPLAEYQSPFLSGAPTYQSFQSPTFPGLVGAPAPGPAPAPAERTAASKVAEYRQWASYGLSDDRIRRIAEVIYGPQTDAAWAELRRMAGVGTDGIRTPSPTPAPAPRTAAPVAAPAVDAGRDRSGFTRDPNAIGASVMTPWYNKKTGQTYMASDTAWDPPNSDWVPGTPPSPVAAPVAAPAVGGGAPGASAAQGKTSDEVWDKNASRNLSSGKHEPTLATWRDPTSGAGVAVVQDQYGRPAYFRYLSADGTVLNTTGFNASDLYANAEKLGMDLSSIGQLNEKLDATGVGYKPYELYKGTGSDHGINFQDIARGGLGTAYDWTKDPLAHLKGPTGQRHLDEDKALAERLGVEKNPFVTTERGIDPTRFTTLTGGSQPRSNVAFTGGTASWYNTPEQAQNYLNRIGGGDLYDTSSGAPLRVGGTRGPEPLSSPTSGLDLKSSTGIANAYDQFLASQQGGDTAASRAQAQNFLQAQGVQQPLINQAYDVYKNDLMDPKGIASKYNEFISSRGGDTEANRAEALQYLQGQGIAQPMINQAYDVFKQGKFAHGGAVQMEDGGFVMTKRAVDGAGGPRGIQQLVPGARMIRGPGHGTSDSIPAVINGRNGQTPARLSNGEAYVPPGRNTKGLYALMHQLERKA